MLFIGSAFNRGTDLLHILADACHRVATSED
jgi:hypothetical protein